MSRLNSQSPMSFPEGQRLAERTRVAGGQLLVMYWRECCDSTSEQIRCENRPRIGLPITTMDTKKLTKVRKMNIKYTGQA